jgi:hypothetical protein
MFWQMWPNFIYRRKVVNITACLFAEFWQIYFCIRRKCLLCRTLRNFADGLENRFTSNGNGGSNPSSSV